MAMLHIVNKSPYETSTMESCLNHAKEGDTVLLIEDAVYAAMKGGRAANALSADLKARGIGEDRIVEGTEVVDYGGFVDLVEANDKTQSWL